MKSVLSICGTRGRPKELKRMLQSFKATKKLDTDIFVYVSCDDPCEYEYMDIMPKWCKWMSGPHKYYGDVMNYAATVLFPDYDYYQEVNDDHVYISPGWDEMLVGIIERNGNGWGIAHPNKRGSPTDLSPSAYMMSGNIVRATGWFTLPGLRMNSIDNAIFKFGCELHRYWYVPDCIIEHRTWSASQRGFDLGVPRDSNADSVYAKEEEARGSQISESWDYLADVRKVQEAMRK